MIGGLMIGHLRSGGFVTSQPGRASHVRGRPGSPGCWVSGSSRRRPGRWFRCSCRLARTSRRRSLPGTRRRRRRPLRTSRSLGGRERCSLRRLFSGSRARAIGACPGTGPGAGRRAGLPAGGVRRRIRGRRRGGIRGARRGGCGRRRCGRCGRPRRGDRVGRKGAGWEITGWGGLRGAALGRDGVDDRPGGGHGAGLGRGAGRRRLLARAAPFQNFQPGPVCASWRRGSGRDGGGRGGGGRGDLRPRGLRPRGLRRCGLRPRGLRPRGLRPRGLRRCGLRRCGWRPHGLRRGLADRGRAGAAELPQHGQEQAERHQQEEPGQDGDGRGGGLAGQVGAGRTRRAGRGHHGQQHQRGQPGVDARPPAGGPQRQHGGAGHHQHRVEDHREDPRHAGRHPSRQRDLVDPPVGQDERRRRQHEYPGDRGDERDQAERGVGVMPPGAVRSGIVVHRGYVVLPAAMLCESRPRPRTGSRRAPGAGTAGWRSAAPAGMKPDCERPPAPCPLARSFDCAV